MGVFYAELGALYSAALTGQACDLPRLPIQYADFAAWQAARLEGEPMQAQLGYWTRQLAGAPPLLELPTDLPRPVARGGASGYAPLRVPADVSQRLRDLASAAGATMFMLVLAAWQARGSRALLPCVAIIESVVFSDFVRFLNSCPFALLLIQTRGKAESSGVCRFS